MSSLLRLSILTWPPPRPLKYNLGGGTLPAISPFGRPRQENNKSKAGLGTCVVFLSVFPLFPFFSPHPFSFSLYPNSLKPTAE